jgi:glucose/arabinose dehydrogenase
MLLRLIKTFVCILSSALLTHVAHADIEIQTIAEGFDTPWSLAELPNNQGFLVTERPGGLHHVSGEGEIQSISGVPDVFAKRQGGLFDVVLHPNFEANNVIFLAYAAGSEDSNRTTVAKATLMGSELTDLSVIFEVTPNKKGGGHFGGRMAFLDDGTLLLSVGEGYTLREDAQKKESQLGKLLRMTETGEAPADNPFTDAPFVYSYGHRNPQGLIVDAPTQTIWMTEHGPERGRRAQSNHRRQKLWVARYYLRCRLLRRHYLALHGGSGYGAACDLLGAQHCNIRTRSLHQRCDA